MTDYKNKNSQNKGLHERHKILTSVLCLLAIWLVSIIFGDSLIYAVKPVVPTANRHQKGKIFLEYADSLSLNELHPEYQVLNGHVKFRKGDMYMYCDSAHFYDQDNRMDAFGNVKMEQGDTLFVYSDVMYYNGQQEIARLRKVTNGVRMEHRNTTLFTDSLDYDLIANVGYYFNGGKIVDDKNTITSVYGQYAPDTKDTEFLFNVTLNNEEKGFVLKTDTLLYNTQSHIADIVGQTTIESDSSVVYTDRGWYNTDADMAKLFNRSLVVGKDGQTLTGDTLIYDRTKGYGEAFGNMVLTDTAKSAILTGGYGYHNEKTNSSFATRRALAMEYSQGDTIFVHGDTIRTYMQMPDSTRVMCAYPNVRFYRTDVQGVCDSLTYQSADSMIFMHRHPIVWNLERQVMGNIIQVHLNDSTVDKAYLPEYGMMAEHIDEEFYNQLSGKKMTAYFIDGELHQLDVDGNVMAIMLPQEKDSTYNKLVEAEGSFLKVMLKGQQMEKLNLWPDVTGKVTPLFLAKKSQYYLKGFQWYGNIRPKDRYDLLDIPDEQRELLSSPETVAPVARIRKEQD